MLWQNKKIEDLTDSELNAAIIKLDWMEQIRANKLSTEKGKKKFLNQPEPKINPSFVQLQNELNSELEKRKLQNV